MNKHTPHLLVLAEDDANCDIVNGFVLDTHVRPRFIGMPEIAGGWSHVRNEFHDEYLPKMRLFRNRHMLLLVDCDGDPDRIETILDGIPADVRDRVFVLGSLITPEKLKSALRTTLEDIGGRLARDCAEGTDVTWSHEQLQHNESELKRLQAVVVPFLFRK